MNDATGVEINLTTAREKVREEGDRRKSEDLPQLLPSDTPETMMNERVDAIEIWMEVFMMDHIPYPMRIQEVIGTPRTEKTQTIPGYL